jgi:hypothetical protein
MGSANTPRKMVDKAFKRFRASTSPDERLSNLWDISQLIEDTTDEELYELAAAVAIEEDPRLRGEICYAIKRSQRPNLIKIVEGMVLDEDQYVRQEALSAISEFLKVVDSVNNAAKLIADSKLKELFSNTFQEQKSVTNFNNNDRIILDDRMRSWETYLRNEKELLRDYKGEYVAIYKGEILGINKSDLELAKMIYDKYGAVEAFIFKIKEEDKEPIEIPPYVGNIVEL